MKRELLPLVLFVLILSLGLASAQYYNYGYGTSGFGGLPSIAELVNNEWVNAAVIFLFVFAFVWFITQQVFNASKPAAVVISIILALIAAFGVVYMYGPIIARFGNLIFFAVFAGIILLLWFQFRHAKTVVFIALAVASLIWLLFLRGQLCPPFGILFQELCVILDVIAIILIIILIIRLLWALFNKLRRGVRQKGGGPEAVELIIESTPGGTTNPPPGSYPVQKNSVATIVPILDYGHVIDHWTVDGHSVRAYTLTIKVKKRTYVRAFFAREGKKKEQEERKAITYEEKKMLPPPAEINRIKRDLMRVQSLTDKEMKKGERANQQRIDKLLAMRNRLQKRLHELRK
ncbi:MAG: hypothetical protein ACPLXC_00215 [Candidatus Pacearchaeota archaeon]